jgi:hypothetical protein
MCFILSTPFCSTSRDVIFVLLQTVCEIIFYTIFVLLQLAIWFFLHPVGTRRRLFQKSLVVRNSLFQFKKGIPIHTQLRFFGRTKVFSNMCCCSGTLIIFCASTWFPERLFSGPFLSNILCRALSRWRPDRGSQSKGRSRQSESDKKELLRRSHVLKFIH